MRSTTIAGLVLAILAVVGVTNASAATNVQQANAVSWDQWQSPSGNIRCAYGDQIGVACWTRNNGRYAFIRSFGSSSTGYGRTTLGPSRVLGYGRTWRISSFSCTSRTSGMDCRSSYTGHGFHIDRDRAWRW